MNELIGSLLDNDSPFGRIMTRFGIIIGANLMFLLFAFPIVTLGPAIAALYHVMLKTLRGDGVINPFKQFWEGFCSNFKQAMIAGNTILLLAVVFYVEFRVAAQMPGALGNVRYALALTAAVGTSIALYIFPVMAAFADTLPNLVRNAVFFLGKKPWKLLVIAFFDLFPLYLTYTDPKFLPLYAFLWVMFGFGALAMLGATLLLPDFRPFLPLVDDAGDFLYDEAGNLCMPGGTATAAGQTELSEKETLEVMKKLGM